MGKKLYLKKGNMYVLKTPVDFNGYTILAIWVDKYWNQLIRGKKWDKQKSFINNNDYDVIIDNFTDDIILKEFMANKHWKKMLEHIKEIFSK